MVKHDSTAKVLPLTPSPSPSLSPAREQHFRVGRLVTGSGLRVDFPGNARGPVEPRVLDGVDPATLRAGALIQREVLLMFPNGVAEAPLLVGLLATEALEIHSAKLDPDEPDVVEVGGRRIELHAEDELVLRCGESSLTLRRNGRVVLQGVHVESCSEGVNRIRGGSIQLN